MRRWALRAANTLLFVACCYLAAGIVRDFLAQALLPAHAEVIAPAAAPVANRRSTESSARNSAIFPARTFNDVAFAATETTSVITI